MRWRNCKMIYQEDSPDQDIIITRALEVSSDKFNLRLTVTLTTVCILLSLNELICITSIAEQIPSNRNEEEGLPEKHRMITKGRTDYPVQAYCLARTRSFTIASPKPSASRNI